MSLEWAIKELDNLGKQQLLRRLYNIEAVRPGVIVINGKEFLDFSSNDYLCLSTDPRLVTAGVDGLKRWGCGSRASRLISGNHPLYDGLEAELAQFKGTEAATVFGSGFLCNLSVVSSITGPGDCIFLDRSSHASLIDGALLSRARIFRFRHNDLDHLKELFEKKRNDFKKCLVIAESVYSMDGDLSDWEAILELCKLHKAIFMLDEAHAIGVFGKDGEGIVPKNSAEKPHILIGTFGKALGSYGAFCCVSSTLKEFLINKARGLMYSTALPPSILNVNLKSISVVKTLVEERAKLLEKAQELRQFINNLPGVRTLGSSQIVPILMDSVEKAIELEKFLMDHGIFAKAIRPPTVPKESPRIRLSLTSGHSEEAIEFLKARLSDFFLKDNWCD